MARMIVKSLAALAFGALSAACATQSYERVSSLTTEEASLMSCQGLADQYLSVRKTDAQLKASGNMTLASLSSLPLDFGVGNLLARTDARDAAGDRMEQIRLTMAAKSCRNVPEKVEEKAGLSAMITDSSLVRSASRLVAGR